MAEKVQNYQNHARFVPVFHIGVLGIFTINFFYSLYHLWNVGMQASAVVAFLMALALIMALFTLRIQVLTVQNRVIRLEMRLRLKQVLPADLQGRIGDLTVSQLIALRFASDAEMPALVKDVLDGKLPDQKSIKLRVQSWQADWLRA